MIGANTKVIVGAARSGRRTASKKTASLYARALDERLGGTLRGSSIPTNEGSVSMLHTMAAAHYWHESRSTIAQGRNGNFGYSSREVSSGVPSDQSKWTDQMTQTWLEVQEQVDAVLESLDDSGASIPDWWFVRPVLFNERGGPIDLKKSTDTIGVLEPMEPTDEDRAAFAQFILGAYNAEQGPIDDGE